MKLTKKILNAADEVIYLSAIDDVNKHIITSLYRRIARAHIQETGFYTFRLPTSHAEKKIILILKERK